MPSMAASGVRMSWLRRPHEGALEAALLLGPQTPQGQVAGDAAHGQHPGQGQQAVEQTQLPLLPLQIPHIGGGIHADADAAQHVPFPVALMAAQAALLRGQRPEQAQTALRQAVLAAEEDLPAPRGRGQYPPLPVIGPVARPQGAWPTMASRKPGSVRRSAIWRLM